MKKARWSERRGKSGGTVEAENIIKKRVKHYVVAYESTLSQTVDK